jgi:NAD-dependent DNA ligase
MKIGAVIEELKKDPDEILTNIDGPNLKKVLEYLSNYYYNNNVSLVSDQLFDYIKEFYEKNFNQDKKITIGAPIPEKLSGKVKLPYFMGSLDKIKPSTNAFNKWIESYSGPYVLSYKLDGISALLYKKGGKLFLYTRGNGSEGQDISHVLKYININTNKLEEGDAIRGELIISKTNFKTIEDQMANSRNAVSGIINTKKPDPSMLKLVDFVAYWVLSPSLKQTEQMAYIEKKNFTTKWVDYVVKNKITTEELSEMLLKGRKDYKYEIDGVVVIDSSKYYPIIPNSNPEFGFAFKQVLTDQIAETTVIDVIWEISKDMYIKPKIKIDTVEIGGAEINYATANNAKFIVDNKIGPGSKIKIIRSGDVIPKIEEILSISDSGKPKMPSIEYEWNETEVDIIATNLEGDDMNKLIVKKLAYFFSTLDIKFMGEGNITKFVDNGYDDLWKILLADKSKVKDIEGFGAKSVDNIYTSLDEGLTHRQLYDIMAASQVFGRGIGTRKFKSIIDVYPNIMDIYKTEGKDHTVKIINALSGFDVKTTNKIVDSMDAFIEYYKKLVKIKPNVCIGNNKEKSKEPKEHKEQVLATGYSPTITQYSGKTIVFTGFRDRDIQKVLESIGAKITDSVSKKTNLVVAIDPNESTSKLTKAKELSIPIMGKDEFIKSISK